MKDTHHPLIVRKPVSQFCPMTAGFGEVSDNPEVRKMRKNKPHTGYDFGPDPKLDQSDTDIYAVADGPVAVVAGPDYKPTPEWKDDGLGNRISQYVEKANHTGYAVYGHLKKIFVKKGEFVKEGQRIATMGKTGGATGVHLHWGFKKLPELAWIPCDDFYDETDLRVKDQA